MNRWLRFKVELLRWIAKRFVPREIQRFVVLNNFVEATTGKYGHTVVPELTVMELLRRLYP